MEFDRAEYIDSMIDQDDLEDIEEALQAQLDGYDSEISNDGATGPPVYPGTRGLTPNRPSGGFPLRSEVALFCDHTPGTPGPAGQIFPLDLNY